MDYLDFYRARTLRDGTIPQERVESKLAKDFKEVLNSSPNRITIIDGKSKYSAILQSGNARVGTQTERKVIQYLLSETKNKLDEGKVFQTWNDTDGTRNWIVLHREIHPYNGYFKYKVLELNYKIKYVNKSGILREIPAYINGTGEFDIKEYFRYSNSYVLDTPNRYLNLVLAENKELLSGLKFVIGDEAWKLVDSDKISIPGVYYTTLVKTQVNDMTDDINNDIANKPKIGTGTILSTYMVNDNTINIARYIDDLYFYEMANGELQDNKMNYKISDNSVLNFVDGKFVSYKIGSTSIQVDDGNYNSKTFTVNVKNSIAPNVFLVGNTKVRSGFSINYKVFNSYQLISFKLEDSSFGYLKEKEGILTFVSNGKMGKTKIIATGNGYSEKEFPIEVVSLAV